MKHIILLTLTICFFSIQAYGQSDLPIMGTISDVAGKTKVYMTAETQQLKLLRKEFEKQKGLELVTDPSLADFVIEYRLLRTEQVTSLQLSMDTGQMDVYLFRDKHRVIAWSGGKTGSLRPVSVLLLREFLKAFNKIK